MKLSKSPYLVLLLLGALCTLSGCAAMAVADRVVPKKPQDLPNDIRIDVPFFAQTENLCGPSTLAMVANYYGYETNPDDISRLVYIPKKKGSLQIEMRAAARNLDLVAYTMNMDLDSLSAEIDAERPVIVLQNLALNVYPVWHYSVVTGRAPDNDYLLLHSGRHKYYRTPWTTFKNTWERSNYWALIVTPIGDIPTSANEDVVIEAALGLEKTGRLRAAQMTYAAAAERWPESFTAHVGLANTHMRLHEPLAASQAYKQALQLNTRSAAVLNNFAYSAFDLGCEVTALMAARCAMKIDKSNQLEIAATLSELKDMTASPINHARCPKIRCNDQAIASN